MRGKEGLASGAGMAATGRREGAGRRGRVVGERERKQAWALSLEGGVEWEVTE